MCHLLYYNTNITEFFFIPLITSIHFNIAFFIESGNIVNTIKCVLYRL